MRNYIAFSEKYKININWRKENNGKIQFGTRRVKRVPSTFR